jgi:hypothetical protein
MIDNRKDFSQLSINYFTKNLGRAGGDKPNEKESCWDYLLCHKKRRWMI